MTQTIIRNEADVLYLEEINSPKDLKKLKLNELELLAAEIREFLINSLAETGGHLSSNLGVVELSIALHYCYNTPRDKIIWDVGHQSYVHKILTGRRDEFSTLRQLGGLSGFPKSSESRYDAFDTGHSSTSISIANAMAEARKLSGKKYRVAAVIGDGSLTGGLAYEALNNAGRSDANLTVILNDNQMSISENVGALSWHLNQIRTSGLYIGAKRDVSRFLNSVPVVGESVGRAIESAKNLLKYTLLNGVLFEEMGFRYYGPIDGNDLESVISMLRQIRKIEGPVLLHVCTQKGKGYRLAEKQPTKYHGVGAFDINTGRAVKKPCGEDYSALFGKKLVELGRSDSRIVAITAAMQPGTGLNGFAKAFPERSFDVGIAEGHAATFAAGLAKSGFVPVFAVYSTFLQRAYDQILHDICIQNLPVVLAVDRAGIVGPDGCTHQGVFDLSYLSHIPNMHILAPKDGAELAAMLEYAVKLGKPCAIRYPKGEPSTCFEQECPPIMTGQAEMLLEGDGEIALAAVGAMTGTALAVCNKLEADGLKPTLINARFVKPIGAELVEQLGNYKYVFTLEDNALIGGFGSSLMMKLCERGNMPVMKMFGIPDKFIEHGSREELLTLLGLDTDSIYNSIREFIDGKQKT